MTFTNALAGVLVLGTLFAWPAARLWAGAKKVWAGACWFGRGIVAIRNWLFGFVAALVFTFFGTLVYFGFKTSRTIKALYESAVSEVVTNPITIELLAMEEGSVLTNVVETLRMLV